MKKDTMESLVSEIGLESQNIYYEGILGLSAELRSTKENTDIIQKQNEHTKSELAKANTKLNKTLAELEKLKGKLLGRPTSAPKPSSSTPP
jgi:hypothetical protein